MYIPRLNDAAWKIIFYRFNFVLIILQSGYALFSLLSISKDPKKAFIFGLSYERLLLLSAPLIFVLIGVCLLFISWRYRGWLVTADSNMRAWLAHKHRLSQMIVACIVCLAIGYIYFQTVSQESFYIVAPPEQRRLSYMVYFVEQIYAQIQPYLIRFQPVMLLLMGVCVQITILIAVFLSGSKVLINQLMTDNIPLIAGIFGALLIFWKAVGWTQLPLSPDYEVKEWAPLGTPILDTQVLLSLMIVFLLIGSGIFIQKIFRRLPLPNTKGTFKSRLDLVLGLMIWLIAAAYWVSIPTQASDFAAEPRYPNFAYYPNSDAFAYDTTAQNLIVGAGYKTRNLDYPRRPAYALLLAFLISIFDQNYEVVTLVQSAVLAIFPGLIYILTAKLYNRLTALIAAILVVLREGNAIILSGGITTSNSRVIMSEMPASVGIALLVLIFYLWEQQSERRYIYSLLIGGITAFFMLIRNEVGIFLPLSVLFAGFHLVRHPKKWLTNALLVALGALLFLAPWIWRNWKSTGMIYLDTPSGRLGYFLNRLGTRATDLPSTNTATQEPQPQGKTTSQFSNPSLSHFINSQVQAILIFPDAYRAIDSAIGLLEHGELTGFLKTCCSREDYISRLFPFWHEWAGNLPTQSVIPISLTLLMIVIGLIKAWEKHGIFGMFPLSITMTHYLISSAVRVSGGRFVQTVDWVWIVYYSVGLGQVVIWTVSALVGSKLPEFLVELSKRTGRIFTNTPSPRNPSWGIYVGMGVVIFLLGAAIPLAEYMIKPRYTPQTQQLWLGKIKQSRTLLANYPNITRQINNLRPDDPRLFQGRALYPRFYNAGESDPGAEETWNAERDYDRMSFYIVGPVSTGVVLPLDKQPDITFPHAIDVLVIGCQEDNYVRARVVYYQTPETVLVSAPFSDMIDCQSPLQP